jgi:hypothetical protein
MPIDPMDLKPPLFPTDGGSILKLDRPHGNIGQHADLTVPLLPVLPAAVKFRIDQNGRLDDAEFHYKGGAKL